MDRYLHEILDIIIWGRSYWWLHKEIDKPAKELGVYHRIYNHDWYHEFKRSWDWENPFPKGKLDKEIPEIIALIPSALSETFEELVMKESRLPWQKGLVKEAFQAYTTHCFYDRLWDESSSEVREYAEKLLITWILNPKLLYDKAGVDISSWKIKVKRNGEVWEDSPGLEKDYNTLVKFLNKEGIIERLFGRC